MKKAKVLLIFLGITKRQKDFWDTYHNLESGMDHDIVVGYRDRSVVPKIHNSRGSVFYHKKEVGKKDVPFQAFGGYRYFYNLFKDQYDYYGFISDDVLIRSGNWLKKCVEPLTFHPLLGWTATQVYSRSTGPGCPNHFKAPIWFAKNSALRKIKWVFDHDHAGEILTADQFLEAGYFGIQVGHKFDVAYDSLEFKGYFEGDTIICRFENKFFPQKNLRQPFSKPELKRFETELWQSILTNDVSHWTAISPSVRIGKANFITELQGLDGQIYVPSLSLAKKYLPIFEHKMLNIQILERSLPSDLRKNLLLKKAATKTNIFFEIKQFIKNIRWYL